MVTKLEAGKSYKLVNKEGWLLATPCNTELYNKLFLDDKLTLTKVINGGCGYVGNYLCITDNELEFFEEVKGPTFSYHVHSTFFSSAGVISSTSLSKAYQTFEEAEEELEYRIKYTTKAVEFNVVVKLVK
jgi:hypothetical protein